MDAAAVQQLVAQALQQQAQQHDAQMHQLAQQVQLMQQQHSASAHHSGAPGGQQGAAPAPGPMLVPRDRPRLPGPPPYTGAPGTLDEWLSAMRRQFAWYGVQMHTDDERIRFATAYLAGSAWEWWDKLSAKPATWADLVTQLHGRWQPGNSADTARAKLFALTQGKLSVHDYVDAFWRLLARIPDMGESDRLFQFQRGLRPHIAMQLRIHGVNTMDAAVQMAVRVGSLGEMAATATHATAPSSSGGAPTPMQLDTMFAGVEGLEADTAGTPGTRAGSSDANTPVTRAELQQMLNAVRHQRRQDGGAGKRGGEGAEHRRRPLPVIPHLSPEQVKQYMDAGKCFGCGATDHSSRRCPKRKVGADGRVSWSN